MTRTSHCDLSFDLANIDRFGRWCFSTLGCPQLSLDEVLGVAQMWGFEGVELRALEHGIDLVENLKRRYREPACLAKALEGQSVRISALDASMHLRHSKQCDRDELLALAHWADGLGIERLRVFDGGRDEKKLSANARDDMLRTLDWWVLERRRAGFKCDLMIETHWILTEPENCLGLVEAAPVPLGILWDSFHTWAHGSRPLEETWAMLFPHVCHIHMRDGFRDPTKPEGAVYTLPGKGAFPLQRLLQLTQQENYHGWLSFEWERYWHPELPPLEEALLAGRRMGLW